MSKFIKGAIVAVLICGFTIVTANTEQTSPTTKCAGGYVYNVDSTGKITSAKYDKKLNLIQCQ